jgi:hypothetical protein
VFTGDLPLLCTWPELDPYERGAAQWLGPGFVTRRHRAAGRCATAPWARLVRIAARGGRKVFAYLKASHAAHGAVLKGLVEEGCRVLAYVPEVAAGGRHRWSAIACCTPSAGVAAAGFGEGGSVRVPCRRGDAGAIAAGRRAAADAAAHTEQFLSARRVAMSGAGYNAALLTPDRTGAPWCAACSMRQAIALRRRISPRATADSISSL